MALHNIHYQRWKGRHEGIWQRRLVIASRGLRGCLANRWMRYLVGLCWGLCLGQVMALFVMGQLLVEDSLVVRWAATLKGPAQVLVGGMANWLATHPEVSVRSAENLIFYGFTAIAISLNIMAVLLAIPHLITRDLSSNALLIYSSKALTRWDYLLGKFGTLLGLLTLTWLGPTLVAWVVGNLLAPKWHFFWHARIALTHVLIYTIGAGLFLSLFGLGISAISGKERVAVGCLLVFWLVGGTLVPISQTTSPWLQFLSFEHDLRQLAIRVYQPKEDIQRFQEQIPIVREMFRRSERNHSELSLPPRPGSALLALSLMAAGACWLLNFKTRSE